jgi:hypothetical protein
MTLGDDRKAMSAALKKLVAPHLRSLGFTGSFPHYRRLLEERTDLLTFQFDRHGGGFVVEVGKCPPGDFVMAWGERIPAEEMTAHHLHPNDRLRLGRRSQGQDHWFRYDRAKGRKRALVFDSLANEVLSLVDEQAQAWWQAT